MPKSSRFDQVQSEGHEYPSSESANLFRSARTMLMQIAPPACTQRCIVKGSYLPMSPESVPSDGSFTRLPSAMLPTVHAMTGCGMHAFVEVYDLTGMLSCTI